MEVYVDEKTLVKLREIAYPDELGTKGDIDVYLKGSTKNGITHPVSIKSLAEKDHQIELLNKRWELLKDFIKEEIEFDKSEYEDYGAPRYRYYLDAETLILDKMKELEQQVTSKLNNG